MNETDTQQGEANVSSVSNHVGQVSATDAVNEYNNNPANSDGSMTPQSAPRNLNASSNDLSTPKTAKGGVAATYSKRNQPSENWFLFDDDYVDEGPSATNNKEKEERIKKIREQQEEERKKKLEELKQHAAAAQKFREQQELLRRKHIEEMRYREQDKLNQVAERRRAIELADRERKEAMLKKAQEREEKIMERKRAQQNHMNYAFGSSTPRTLHPNVGSTTDVWGSSLRSPSSNAHPMSQSMYSGSRRSVERDNFDGRSKRATSVTGLDKKGQASGDVSVAAAAAKKLSLWRDRNSEVNRTSPGRFVGCRPPRPKNQHRNNDMSSDRYTYTRMHTPMSSDHRAPFHWFIKEINIDGSDNGNAGQQHLASSSLSRARSRNDSHFALGSPLIAGENIMTQSFSSGLTSAHRRRTDLVPTIVTHPRPTRTGRSTTPGSRPGMSRESSIHGSRPTSALSAAIPVRMRVSKTPSSSRKPRPTSIATTGIMSQSMIERKATTPTQPRLNQKQTPRAEPRMKRSRSTEKNSSAASTPTSSQTPKMPVVRKTIVPMKTDSTKKPKSSKTPSETSSPATKSPSKSNEQEKKEPNGKGGSEQSEPPGDESSETNSTTGGKKVITSEEEAKARLAEKRREMKEKMEREAEMERQRQAALAREEEEQRLREEEEERRQIEEAKRIEEERLRKAIEEAKAKEEEERRQKEEEERLRREKAEAEQRAREEAEQKQRELEEKLRKEEEERLARKKRIEEIMARTRGGSKANTPKKEDSPVNGTSKKDETGTLSRPADEESEERSETNSSSNKSNGLEDSSRDQSSSPVVDREVKEEGEQTQTNVENTDKNDGEDTEFASSDDQAKEEQKVSSDALNLSEFETVNVKQAPAAPETGNLVELEQVLDLNRVQETHTSNGSSDSNGPPKKAFEENQGTHVEDLLS